jgi:colicin import membrane protein
MKEKADAITPALYVNPPEEKLGKGLRWSFIAHIVFGAAVLIKSWVFPSKVTPFVPTLKVDLVGLPDVLKKDLKKPNAQSFNKEIQKLLKAAEEKAKPAPDIKKDSETKKAKESPAKHNEMAHQKLKQQDELGEKKIEKRNKRALDRIKSIAKIQDISDEVESPSSPAQKAPPIKGNKISAGASLSGDAKEASEANYLELLRDHLQENWTLPAWLSRQSLQALVQIYIDSKGRLRGMKFIKSSGNTQFDDSVKKALQESQPFPAPPHNLETAVLTEGISVGFPL